MRIRNAGNRPHLMLLLGCLLVPGGCSARSPKPIASSTPELSKILDSLSALRSVVAVDSAEVAQAIELALTVSPLIHKATVLTPVTVILWLNRFFIGPSQQFTNSPHTFAPEWDGQASSLMVTQPVWVTFYAGPTFSGDKFHVRGPFQKSSLQDIPKSFPLGNWEDEIRSFLIRGSERPDTKDDMVCDPAPGRECYRDTAPPHPPSGPGTEIRRICHSSPMPLGWIGIARVRDNLECESPSQPFYHTVVIRRFDNAPLGTRFHICPGQTTPAGWTASPTDDIFSCPRDPGSGLPNPRAVAITRVN
jgi:hypothetical protein